MSTSDSPLQTEHDVILRVLSEHESLLGSDDYTHCACGAETVNLAGLRTHVAEALVAAGLRFSPEQWHLCGHDYDPCCDGCQTAHGDAGGQW